MLKERFEVIVKQFTNELSLSFPELQVSVDAFLKTEDKLSAFSPLAQFLKEAVQKRDKTFFSKARGQGVQILPNVFFPASLWKECSNGTQKTIWDYLNSMILVSDLASGQSGEVPDIEKVIENMAEEFKSSDFKEMFSNLKGTFEKMATSVPQTAPTSEKEETDGAEPAFKIPTMPPHLQNGQIAKIAQELAGEFKPEDLGIQPELMEKMNPMQVFEHLQFVYTNKPELLTGAMKRVAKKLQNKFQSGSLNRETLMAEAKELMEHFTNNDAFRNMFQTFGDVFGGADGLFGGPATAGQPSERLNAVRSRLKKKLGEKKGGAK